MILDAHKLEQCSLIGFILTFTTWIKSYKSDEPIATAFSINDSNLSLCLNMNEPDAVALIDALYRHIANIKANEIELIARSDKVAA